MAKRDVELVIRARDQAAKAVETVTDAMKDLHSTQEAVGRSAQRTDGLLGQLSSEFSRLNAEVKGLTALGKIAGQMDKAARAVERLEQKYASAVEESKQLSAQNDRASASLKRLEGAARSTEAALRSSKDQLAGMKREQTQLRSQVDALKNGYSKLHGEFKKAEQPSESLRASLRAQANALFDALQRQDDLAVAIKRQTDAVNENKAAHTAANGAVRSATSSQAKIEASVKESAEALEEQAAALEQARTDFREIKNVADQASASLNNVAADEREVAEASRQAAEDVKRVSDALARQARQGGVSVQATDQGGAAGATAAYRAQGDELRRLKQEWAEAQTRVKQLAGEMKQASAPSQKLRTEFLLAKEQASQAKTAFLAQEQAVARLRQGIAATRAVVAAFGPVMRTVGQESQAAGAQGLNATNSFQAMLQRLLGVDKAAIEASQSMRRMTNETRNAAAGVGTWGESTRRALSLGQRLRGEVLSLATAYFGLYNAVSQIGDVVQAFRTLEAATSRLGVVFDQDLTKVREELRFLEQQADRLGLNFGTLSDEYSKFAVAASSANFSIEEQRRLFLAVAESARVNKVSTEQLSGIYLALTQMMSKGKVTSEELRRQLGDRMAGAFNLFAEAMGVTTAELDDMLRKGEVLANSDTLIKFAERLEQKFGPQLGAALKTTTTELDRFGNNIFQAQLLIGQGGFIEALTEVVQDLNAQFKTREGKEFFLSLGSAMGSAVRLLGVFVANFDKVILAAKVGIAVVLGQFLRGLLKSLADTNVLSTTTVARINGMTTSFRALAAATSSGIVTAFNNALALTRGLLTGTNVQLTAMGVRARVSSGALAVLRVSMTATATAARALWTAIGGFPGLILTAATFALSELFASFITKVPPATRAFEEHERQLELVAAAYREAKDAGREFSGTIEGVSLALAERNLDELANAFVKARNKIKDSADGIEEALRQTRGDEERFGQAVAIRNLVNEFRNGKISALAFQNALNEMYAATESPAVRKLVQDLLYLSQEARDAEIALGNQAAIAKALGSEISTLDGFMVAVGSSMSIVTGEVEDQADALDDAAKRAESYAAALAGIQQFDPAAKEAAEYAKNVAEVEAKYKEAVANASTDEERNAAAKARDAALEALRSQTQAYKDAQKAQDDLARAEEQRRERIASTTEELQFQLDQLQRTAREQAVASALRGAGLAPGDSSAEANTIRGQAGALFDAEAVDQARRTVADLRTELSELKGIELSKEEFIANEARRDGIDLLSDIGREYANILGQIYDVEAANAQMKRDQEELRGKLLLLRDIEQQRANAVRDLQQATEDQDKGGIAEARQQVEQLTVKLTQARDEALALATALGDQRAINALNKVNLKLDEQVQKTVTAKQVNELFAQGATQAFRSVGTVLGQWIDGTEEFGKGLASIRDAFRAFASDFLQRIADMIIQQLILNALQSSGFGGAVSGGVNAVTRHTGGLADSSGTQRMVDSGWFRNAVRYHEGGIAGLQPGEIPAILKRNEEVLTEDDPRHIFNGGGGSRKEQDIKIINTLDPADFISKGVGTAVGEKAILNFIRQNSEAVKSAIGQ